MIPSKLECFAHYHLTIAEYGLWSHLRELSSKFGYVYKFSDRKIAERFAKERGSSKSTVNTIRQSLVRKGFIVWLGKAPAKRAGGGLAREGRILSHREWAELHPGECAALAERRMCDCPELPPELSSSDGVAVQKAAPTLSGQPDVNMIGNCIQKQDGLNRMVPSVELDTSPSLDSAYPQRHSGGAVRTTGQVVAVQPVGQTSAPFGLRQDNGEWFTESGLRVHPDVVSVLFGKEVAA